MIEQNIVVSDLFDVKCDAIVIPCSKQSTLLWGSHISEKLRKTCGASAIKARKELGWLELGEARSANISGLPYPNVIFVAVLNVFDMNPLFLIGLQQRISDDTLSMATQNALQCAAEANASTVAFSAIGAGKNAMSMQKCGKIMRQVVKKYGEETSKSSIERVVFAVYKDAEAKKFLGQ